MCWLLATFKFVKHLSPARFVCQAHTYMYSVHIHTYKHMYIKTRWGQKEVKMSANTLAYNYSTQKGRRTTGQGEWKTEKCEGGWVKTLGERNCSVTLLHS